MNFTLLRGSIVVLGLIAFCVTSLSESLAQSGEVGLQPRVIDLDFSPQKVTEADGTAIVNLPLTFTFNSQTAADNFDGQNPLTVSYVSENRTATAGTCGTAGADYVSSSSTVTFTGQLSQAATIQICSDELSEGDEEFRLRFSIAEPLEGIIVAIRPTTTSGSNRVGTIVITDDESPPALGITPAVRVDEPSSGQATATFTVSLTGPITQRPVTVDFATAPGTAAAGSSCPLRTENIDYITKSGTLTFTTPPGQLISAQVPRTQRVQVAVCTDNRPNEPTETFFVNLTRPVNATLSTGGKPPTIQTVAPPTSPARGTATIVD